MGTGGLLGPLIGGIGDMINAAQWEELRKRTRRDTNESMRDTRDTGKEYEAALRGLNEDERKQAEFTRRYSGDLLRGAQGESEAALGKYLDPLSGDVRKGNADIMGRYEKGAGDATAELVKRYQRGMGYIDQLGGQSRMDINQTFDTAGKNQAAKLAASGLGNTGAIASFATGNARERAGSLGRLNEQLAGLRLNTDASLSGDIANQYGRNAEYGSQLGGSLLDRQLGMDTNIAGAKSENASRYADLYAGQQGEMRRADEDRYYSGLREAAGVPVATTEAITGIRQGQNYVAPQTNPLSNFGASWAQVRAGNQANDAQRRAGQQAMMGGLLQGLGSAAGGRLSSSRPLW